MPANRSRAGSAGRIALIGFGEAGQAFVRGWRSQGPAAISAFDIKTDSADPAIRAGKLGEYVMAGIEGRASLADALSDAPLVFSVVTASEARAAARAASAAIGPGAFFFDCNSCAPQTKTASADLIEAAGGRYVDVAVMAPVHPRLHRTPLLISGPHAEAALAVLAALDMQAELLPGPVGEASSIKMVRSIMIKGLEALVLECVLSGRRAGVDDVVLASLEASFPGFDWRARAAYMMERVVTHGRRRAEEMREVALTVDLLGLEGGMARATVDWQQRVADLGLNAASVDQKDYRQLADLILGALERKGRAS